MSDLSSFYGGRRGFSFNLVKRFDGYDIPTTTYCKSYYATSDGINFIVTDQAHGGNVLIDTDGHYLIKRDRYNYLNTDKWVLQNDDGSYINGTSYKFPTRIAEGLVQCFEKGLNSLNEVGYGEYVIIDSVDNLDNYDDPDNGKLYRRGLGPNGVYDAEYICQVSGPQGGTLVNTIVNRNGVEMPREKFIKLEGALYAEDDAEHERTKLFVDVPTPESIGIGIGLSEDVASTDSRTASLQDYVLTKNGIVAVRFTTAVVANATLNINGKGAKDIYYKNAVLVSNVIKAGDTVTFVYDGSKYHILSIDRSEGHVIQDKDGVSLSNRGKLQFTGNVVVTDNSANDKTIVEIKGDEITEIDYDDYMVLDPEDREGNHYIITNPPGRLNLNEAVFALKNKTLIFNNKVATVLDSRITDNTYVFPFYHNEAVAQAAQISDTWQSGSVTFTVVNDPTEDIVVDILCVIPALASPYYNLKAEFIDYNNETVKTVLDNLENNLTAGNLEFQFATDGSKYGYKDINGNFIPFKNPVGTKSITSNGTYDVADYASANVNVPQPSGTINITSNGVKDVANYVSANVNVPQPSGTINITTNGTHNVTNYVTALVNVPNSNTETYTPTSRSQFIDMGASNNYRYLDTRRVPNENLETIQPQVNNSRLDMGLTNNVRFIDTTVIYALGQNSANAYFMADKVSVTGQTSISIVGKGVYIILVNRGVYFKGYSSGITEIFNFSLSNVGGVVFSCSEDGQNAFVIDVQPGYGGQLYSLIKVSE